MVFRFVHFFYVDGDGSSGGDDVGFCDRIFHASVSLREYKVPEKSG